MSQSELQSAPTWYKQANIWKARTYSTCCFSRCRADFFYRFDHVRIVSPKLEDALKNLPPATPGDSRTTYISPPVWIEQGEVIGTSVGIFPSNIFVDFGLYDVRAPNNVIPNLAWADLYAADKEFGHYGVCFFDHLPGNHSDIMRSLPTGIEGSTSDYCK